MYIQKPIKRYGFFLSWNFSSIVTSNIKKKNSVDTMQSQKIQSVSFGKICSMMTDFQIILSIQMKNQFILLKYIFICFYLLYCKSVNLHLQTTFKMFLNVSHISVRYSYQASIVTQRQFGPTTFMNIIIMSPLRTKGDILFQSEFFSSPGLQAMRAVITFRLSSVHQHFTF